MPTAESVNMTGVLPPESRYQCPVCVTTVVTLEGLVNHVVEVHGRRWLNTEQIQQVHAVGT